MILFSLWQLSFFFWYSSNKIRLSSIFSLPCSLLQTSYSIKASTQEKKIIPTDTLTLLISINLWCSMRQKLPHVLRLQLMMSYIPHQHPSEKGRELSAFNQSGWARIIGSKVGTLSCHICLRQNISSYCYIRSRSIFCCCGWRRCYLSLFHDGFLLVSLLIIRANGGSTKKASLFDSERLTPRHGVSDLWDIFLLSHPHWCYTGNIPTLWHIVHIQPVILQERHTS